MSVHRYPPNSLVGDYMRAGAGFLVTALPVVWLKPAAPIALMLTLIAIACGYLLYRTMDRQRAVVSFDEQGVMYQAFRGHAFAWESLSSMVLSYYALKRDRTDGWMQLTLKAGPRTIKVDSRLDGFVELVRYSSRAARMNSLPLNPITVANLRALRIL